MLQSFSINNIPNKQIKLNCYRCHKKPKQCFAILLCDHIICAACLDQINQLDNRLYDGIKCTCGVTTYKRITNLYTDDQQDRDNRDNTIQVDRQHYNNQQVSQHQDNKYYQKYQKQKQKNNISVNIHTVNLHRNNKNNNNNNTNNTNNRDKTKQNSKRPSIGLIHSKNTTSTKNISRINTQPYGFVNTSYDNLNNYSAYHNNQNQSVEYEADRERQLTDKFMLQQSKYPVTNNLPTKNKYKQYKQDRNNTRQYNQNTNKQYFNTVTPVNTNRKMQSLDNRKTNIVHHIPKFIDSQSILSQSNDKQNNNPNINYKYLSKKYNRIHTQKLNPNNSLHSLQLPQPQQNQPYRQKPQQHIPHKYLKQKQQKNNLTSQLNSQIKYLKLTHSRNLQTLQRIYLKAKQKINEEYQKLQNNLKDICLQAIVLDRQDTHVNFNKIIQMRYQTCVGKNLAKLTQDIKKYGVAYGNANLDNHGFIYEETSANQLSRYRLRRQRFTSPQPYSNTFIQTQPANINSKSPKYHYSTNYPNLIAQTYSRHNNIPTCTHTPNPSIPTSSKLHKKTAKRRTNIVIQL